MSEDDINNSVLLLIDGADSCTISHHSEWRFAWFEICGEGSQKHSDFEAETGSESPHGGSFP